MIVPSKPPLSEMVVLIEPKQHQRIVIVGYIRVESILVLMLFSWCWR